MAHCKRLRTYARLGNPQIMFVRFRQPRASLELEAAPSPPPSSGAVMVRVRLTPQEPFQIRRGCVALIYTETRFSPTALDGYHEHTTERVCGTEAIAEGVRAQPGVTMEYTVELQMPAQSSPRRESRPTRVAWQVKASFDLRGFRDIHRTHYLADLTPRESETPEVDGRRILPYERVLPQPGEIPLHPPFKKGD